MKHKLETENLHIRKVLPTDYFADDTFNAILDDIDVKVVGISHLASGAHWSIREPDTEYVRKDVVRWPAMKSHQYAECITAGTTSSEDTINNYTTGDIVYDGTVVWRIWSLTEQNDNNGGIIKIWLSGYEYKKGDAALYGKSIYRCTIDHTASSFSTDASKWQEIYASIRPFTVSVYYKIGDTVLQNNLIYKCLTDHVSTNFSTDISNWELVGNLVLLHEWETNHNYYQDELVTHNGQIYRSLTDHTSTTDLETDSSNWELITASIPLWKTDTYYIENSIVHYNNILYKCIDDHISNLTFDSSKWQMLHDPNAFIRNWSANTKYYQNQTVKYAGNLYRCITENNDSAFTIAKWDLLTDSINDWVTAIDYVVGQYVNYNGSLYKCITANNDATFDSSKWQKVSGSLDSWASNTDYSVGDIVINANKIYQCNTAHTSGSTFTPDATKWTEISACITRIPNWEVDTDYVVGDLVAYDSKIYRCTTAHTSDSTAWDSAEEANWEELSPTINEISNWTVSTDYAVGQLVIHDNKLYRCNTAHTSDSTSFNTDIAYWDAIGSTGIDIWRVNEVYTTSNVVIYNNKIYKCNTAHTSGSTFDPTKWDEISSADIGLWQSSTDYKVGNVVIKDNQIYRCKTLHTSDSSDFYTDISKWDILDTRWLVNDWATNTYYFVGEVVLYNNTLYKCTTAHTSLGTFELDKADWEPLNANLRQWISGNTYKIGDTVIYNNRVYECITSDNGEVFTRSNWKEVSKCGIEIWRGAPDTNTLALLHFDSSDEPYKNEYGDSFSKGTVGSGIYHHVNTWSLGGTGYAIATESIGGIKSPDYEFITGSEVYTVEWWHYSSFHYIWTEGADTVNVKDSAGNITSIGYIDSHNGKPFSIYGTQVYEFLEGIPYHIALVISGTTVKTYINGTSVSTLTRPTANSKFWIYGDHGVSHARDNILMDELRISNIDRYSSDFTPQTEPFLDPNFDGYKVNDLVVYNDKIYRCITANNDATFTPSRWVEVSKSIVYPDWSSTTDYSVDDIVIYQNQLYRCITSHTSTSNFNSDFDKWTPLDKNCFIHNWASNIPYYVDEVVKYDDVLYRCKTSHVSTLNDKPSGAILYEVTGNTIEVDDTTTIPYSETIDLGSVKKVTDFTYNEVTTDMSFTYTIETSEDNITFTPWAGTKTNARYVKLTVDTVSIVTGATSPSAYLDDFTVIGESDNWEKISSGGGSIEYATDSDIDSLFN